MNEYLDTVAFYLGYAVMIGAILFVVLYLVKKDTTIYYTKENEQIWSFPFTVAGDVITGSVFIKANISDSFTDHRKYIIKAIAIRTVETMSVLGEIYMSDNLLEKFSKQQYRDLQILLHNQTPNAVIAAQQFTN